MLGGDAPSSRVTRRSAGSAARRRGRRSSRREETRRCAAAAATRKTSRRRARVGVYEGALRAAVLGLKHEPHVRRAARSTAARGAQLRAAARCGDARRARPAPPCARARARLQPGGVAGARARRRATGLRLDEWSLGACRARRAPPRRNGRARATRERRRRLRRRAPAPRLRRARPARGRRASLRARPSRPARASSTRLARAKSSSSRPRGLEEQSCQMPACQRFQHLHSRRLAGRFASAADRYQHLASDLRPLYDVAHERPLPADRAVRRAGMLPVSPAPHHLLRAVRQPRRHSPSSSSTAAPAAASSPTTGVLRPGGLPHRPLRPARVGAEHAAREPRREHDVGISSKTSSSCASTSASRRGHVFGGSWGSTLALAYAADAPRPRARARRCAASSCAAPQEIRWFYQEGASWIFPDVWEEYRERHPRRGARRHCLGLLPAADERGRGRPRGGRARVERLGGEHLEALLRPRVSSRSSATRSSRSPSRASSATTS